MLVVHFRDLHFKIPFWKPVSPFAMWRNLALVDRTVDEFKLPPFIMPSAHLLSVGYDEHLMHTRASVLRQAGFIVDEAFDVNDALKISKADSIDAMVVCHTVPRSEQRFLISAIRDTRGLLPIILISNGNVFRAEIGCFGTSSNPTQLITTVKQAIHK